AAAVGQETPLPSLELATEQQSQMIGNCEAGYSCIYQNTISWKTPTTPLPVEIHPRVVFDRLFGGGTTRAEQLQRARAPHSIWDALGSEVRALERVVGPADRNRLSQYLDALREIERRIGRLEANSAESELDLPVRPVEIPDFDAHVKLMFDLQTLAFQTD